MRKNIPNNGLPCLAGKLDLWIKQQPMRQDFQGDFLNMVGRDIIQPVEHRQSLAAAHQCKRSTGARPQPDAGSLPRGRGQSHHVVLDLVTHPNATDRVSPPQSLVNGSAGGALRERVVLLLRGEDGNLLLSRQITQTEPHGEPVHLGFGQRISPAKLHRVLGRDDEKEFVKLTPLPIDTDLPLPHRLKKSGLRTGGCSVDFVRQQDVRKHRTFMEFKGIGALMKDRYTEDVGRKEVRSELDAPELRINGLREGFGQCGLSGSGIILQQHVTTACQGCQQLPQDGTLPLDHLLNAGFQTIIDLPGRKDIGHTADVARVGQVHKSKTLAMDDGLCQRSAVGITARQFEEMQQRARGSRRSAAPVVQGSSPAKTKRTPQVILGIDPSLRGTGYGVIRKAGQDCVALDHGTVSCPASWPRSRCLVLIASTLRDVIRKHQPSLAVVEGLFFAQNLKTALIMGEARGVSLCAAAEAGLDICEIAPRKVKQAIVGYGAAQKLAVAKMVQRMLNLQEQPAPDAADALALALAYTQENSNPVLNPPKWL